MINSTTKKFMRELKSKIKLLYECYIIAADNADNQPLLVELLEDYFSDKVSEGALKCINWGFVARCLVWDLEDHVQAAEDALQYYGWKGNE